MKIVTAILASVMLAATPVVSHATLSRNTMPAAKQCRDHGKFVKCPTASLSSSSTSTSAASSTAASAKTQCRDPKTGRFIKCRPAVAPKGPCRDPKAGKFTKCH